jgi:hypothetical protein
MRVSRRDFLQTAVSTAALSAVSQDLKPAYSSTIQNRTPDSASARSGLNPVSIHDEIQKLAGPLPAAYLAIELLDTVTISRLVTSIQVSRILQEPLRDF